jgi:hypothetical protein
VARVTGKTDNTFVIFFTEGIPDSRVGLSFGWRGVIERAVHFSGADIVVVVGCKSD